jgi:hypothetical protein
VADRERNKARETKSRNKKKTTMKQTEEAKRKK